MRLADFYVREHVNRRPSTFARFFDGLCRVAGLIGVVTVVAFVVAAYSIPPDTRRCWCLGSPSVPKRVSYVPVALSDALSGSSAWLRRWRAPRPTKRALLLESLSVRLVGKGAARSWLWWR